MEYAEWIDGLFGNEPVDRFGPDLSDDFQKKESELSETEIVVLMAKTFERSGKDLLRFSDQQVALGIKYLIYEGNDSIYCVYNTAVPIEYRKAVIDGMYALNRDCFALRCEKSLGSLDEVTDNPLNSLCYMFWDSGSVNFHNIYKCNDEYRPLLFDTVLDVLERILSIDHIACQEGALHALGHAFDDAYELGEYSKMLRKRISGIITAYLDSPKIDERLRKYALRARAGGVQ